MDTRDRVLKAAMKRERPDTDEATWEIATAWARLWPNRSIPGVLLNVGLLILAFAFPVIWGDLAWVIIAWAFLTLTASLYMNVVTARVRSVADAVAPEPPVATAPTAQP